MKTLKNLCNHLKIELSPEILNQVTFKALLGNEKLIIQGDSIGNSLEIFDSRGINYIYEYLLIFDEKKLIDREINIIKNKGIEKYLSDMQLNLDDNNLQYLINEDCTNNIGKVYIINNGSINNNYSNNINNINNNMINNNNNNIIHSNIINDNSNIQIKQLNPCRLGLNNIGATCYMNATLQCLCNIVQLQKYFLNNTKFNSQAKLSKAFSIVMQNLYNYKNNNKAYSPKNFKETISEMNPLFKGVAANDSKDLILFIFEKIHEELNQCINYINSEQNIPYELEVFRKSYYQNNSSIIEKTFYYEIQTINQCSNCGNQMTNYNIQNIIIFPLEKIRLNCIQKYKDGFYCVYLEECFEQISTPEIMQGVNEIYCNKCCQNSTSLHSTYLNTCP
jgi:ubiquitin C-terminal hydrolase